MRPGVAILAMVLGTIAGMLIKDDTGSTTYMIMATVGVTAFVIVIEAVSR